MLDLFALFHLNLAFSSIEEEARATVIERAYWPALRFAAEHGPIGLEATGYTLEQIAVRDPSWIARFRELISEGKAELVGSGYAQLIGPLVPAKVVAANLRIGNSVYQDLLGVRPTLALVNEQAYSGGLVGHYIDAGYNALLMDWDNPASHHPDWNPEWRYLPQRALGPDGRSIALLWTNTVAFQKLQRYAHGDIELEEYLAFVAAIRGSTPRAMCLYASDAEIFDYRPGRYRTEEPLNTPGEWTRLHQAFAAVGKMDGARLIAPSAALALQASQAGQVLRLETAAYPIPVKKQRKYNISRWAVTGRDDLGINAACQRIYRVLDRSGKPDTAWKELCALWASDFRTHITDKRWQNHCAALRAAEVRAGTALTGTMPRSTGTVVMDRFLEVATPALRARLDRRRGLAIQRIGFAPEFAPVVGGLAHGHFDDISLQADWYTGDCVFEAPGESKVTDLEWAETRILHESDGAINVQGVVVTPLGPIVKIMHFHATDPRVDFDVLFDWATWGKGSLRLGHVTLLPEAFDWGTLALETCNGGFNAERFMLAGETVDHGAPISFLVSLSCGLGMTEGWVELKDARHGIRVEIDRATAPLLGLLTHRQIGGSLFCQLVLSALELDDTRKPDAYQQGPRRVRFSLVGTNEENGRITGVK